MFTISVLNEHNKKAKFVINKYHTFRVLVGMVRYKLLLNAQRVAENRRLESEAKGEEKKEDENDKMITEITEEKTGRYHVKFFYGENELLEDTQIKEIGNEAQIKMKTKYLAGGFCY
uniref:Uncharacterized protein n=1 Tax=Euplotes harpa TaxID=151035 RepID=A0A7S3JF55_9SPIT|mmetsp:Transcript_32455/g.36997  ORF Transcript_32455/g.36997 Transcript_32455/m.36997 type:complete len:117 (+) Transcript_32455:219-569(+)